MKRFCQIVDERAHWVFEAEACPEFHASIHIIDVTDHEPAVQEGWAYRDGLFVVPPPVPMPIQRAPQPIASLFRTIGPMAVERITCFGNVMVRRHVFKQDEGLAGHAHQFDHLSLLLTGSAAVLVDGVETTYQAPHEIIMQKNKRHQITAREDGTIWLCIFAIRDEQGEVTDIYHGDESPYGPKEHA